MSKKLVLAVIVGVVLLIAVPRPVAAQDGCGLLSLLIGCDYDQRALQAEREHNQAMLQINAQATATALGAQHQAQQLEYQRWLASEQAQQELQRIAAKERVSQAEIQARLEQMRAQERMNAVNATTSFNVAALQSDAMIAVADARAAAARDQQVTAFVMLVTALVVAGALIYAASQYRRVAEAQAHPYLLPADDWQRRAVALLEQKRVPYLLRQQQLLAQIDGEWVQVEKD